MKSLIVTGIILLMVLTSSAYAKNDVPYCKDTKPTAKEHALIQKLVPDFAKKMGCEVGDNCLLKWNDKGIIKFSIAWKKRCGPILGGVYQLGDSGLGSTFVCESKPNKTCCWPLGYEQYKQCSG